VVAGDWSGPLGAAAHFSAHAVDALQSEEVPVRGRRAWTRGFLRRLRSRGGSTEPAVSPPTLQPRQAALSLNHLLWCYRRYSPDRLGSMLRRLTAKIAARVGS
jgi:hypothetical protein